MRMPLAVCSTIFPEEETTRTVLHSTGSAEPEIIQSSRRRTHDSRVHTILCRWRVRGYVHVEKPKAPCRALP